MKSFEDLDIYKESYRLALLIHEMSLTLPAYELYEQGSQIRRSTKSIKDNIAEGYGRKRYKAEFIRFLIFSHSSCDEAISQLKMINDIYQKGEPLITEYINLSKKIYNFILYVEKEWK